MEEVLFSDGEQKTKKMLEFQGGYNHGRCFLFTEGVSKMPLLLLHNGLETFAAGDYTTACTHIQYSQNMRNNQAGLTADP